MTNIIELPEVLANQIAAGEVVERPASVVKELVENAIDAKSSQITVEIEESGLKMIQVTDNGEGMSHEDLPLSLRRHATSKIKSQSDLFRIRTLGFRGEALPSVASISKITIKTATKEVTHGSLLIATGGEIETLEAISTPTGTKIKVENLFYNTPARLKYMKSLQAELAHIVDVVNRLSLAHPEVAFTLISDGRQLTQTSGTGDLRQAIAGIYGLNTTKKMLAISNADLDFEVSGYVSLPELTRANRNYMTILVNGRYIKNFLLNRAIVVIDIQIDPYLADVNVHPTKQEVRISKERELMALISTAISESLKEQDLIPDALENLAKSSTRHFSKPEQTQLPLQSRGLYYDPQKNDFFVKESAVSEKIPETDFYSGAVDNSVKVEKVELLPHSEEVIGPSSVKHASRPQNTFTETDHPNLDLKNRQKLSQMLTRLENEGQSVFPELDYFGQMHGTYLFAQGKDGLFIIDQHAAQERVKYEYYRDKIGEVDSSLQQLLVPYLFEFSGSDFINLQEKMALLNEVGIFLEVYGHNTFILREHPIWMKEEEIASGVYEMCDMLLLTNEVSIKTYRAELAIMMSCKRSIKANHSLDDYSARNLLLQLAQCQNPYNCPHGRPVLINFSKADMEKMFRRIQENHTSLRELGKY
ncbi:TPA: DNA mismatch repair endonuclease MutL [Streptococcus pyogenes]